ncbi:hypothetical protein [Persephonella sp.]
MRIVGSLATQFAPPFSLVLHYFIGSVFFNFLSILALTFYKGGFEPPFYLFSYAGFVHLFLLGFVMMTIFGALYQLIPVALEVPVFSFKAGYIQFYIYTAGIVVMVLSMLMDRFLGFLPLGGFLVYVSMLIFIFNFFLSIRNLEKKDITAKFLISANISLLIGITIGIFLALNFVFGIYTGSVTRFIVAHLFFTVFGFVFMVIMGVSMVLLPMFSLAHKFNDIYINVAFYLINVAVYGGGFSVIFADNPAVEYAVFLIFIASILLYIAQVVEIYRNRPRRTKDTGMDTMFFSHGFLIPAVISGLLIPIWEKAVFVFAGFLFLGFFNMLIYGSMYKIVPFLTWFHRFSSLVGKKKVPMLADMLPQKLPDFQVVVSATGLAVFIVGIVLSVEWIYLSGVFLMTAGSLIFIYVIYYVLSFRLEEE